jgi:hypothetical protein
MKRARVICCSGLALSAALIAAPDTASADYFSMYLRCEGTVTSAKGKTGANLDLALRDNNQSATIQQSNVLPVGEKLKGFAGSCSCGTRACSDSLTSGCRSIARPVRWRATSATATTSRSPASA